MKLLRQKSFGKEKGYTLLFAVLIATMVLAVTAFILNVSRKQFLLAITAKQSLYSFYAADSGIECAIYSLSGVATDGSTNQNNVMPSCGSGQVQGGGTFTFISNGSGGFDSNTIAVLFPSSSQCALITIHLSHDASAIPLKSFESKGYNVNCSFTGGAWVPNISQQATERSITFTFYDSDFKPS